jgi:1-acyl-sn-glycerol-3-phosphate acyltransferase
MFLYRLIRPIVTAGYKVYFKKIYHTGGENIPLEKPLLVVANHPTAFLEPTALACVFQQMELYFITRGDVFVSWSRPILKSLNMVPIFRFKDGYANMKQNASTMDYVFKTLSEGKKILIFSEGRTITEKRLRPIQKGTARMALGSYEKYGDLDLQILPIGLTYSNPHQFRSELMIRVGEPFPLRDFYELHAENPNKAIAAITEEIAKRLKPLIVEIEKPEDEDLIESLFSMYRNNNPSSTFPIFEKNRRRLGAQQEIANKINGLSEEKKQALSGQIRHYLTDIHAKGVDDLGVAQPNATGFKYQLSLILGFIPFLVGALIHYPIVAFTSYINRSKVKVLEFEGPVLMGAGTLCMFLYYIFLFVVLIVVNKWLIWSFGIFIPLLGFYALYYWEFAHSNRVAKKAVGFGYEQVLKWRNEREAIMNY